MTIMELLRKAAGPEYAAQIDMAAVLVPAKAKALLSAEVEFDYYSREEVELTLYLGGEIAWRGYLEDVYRYVNAPTEDGAMPGGCDVGAAGGPGVAG